MEKITALENLANQRPTTLTTAQAEKIFSHHATIIKRNKWSSSDIEIIAKDLAILDYRKNGFGLAKQLEDDGRGSYNFDVIVLEQLECVRYDVEGAIEKNIKAWVKGFNVKARFNIGDKLLAKQDLNNAIKKDSEIYITGGKAELAQYYLSFGQKSDSGYVVPFETAHANCEVV